MEKEHVNLRSSWSFLDLDFRVVRPSPEKVTSFGSVTRVKPYDDINSKEIANPSLKLETEESRELQGL